MKMPCEIVVRNILPTARSEIAKELVTVHGLTQTKVAKMFGVTSAAVSQYMKGLRGGNSLLDSSSYKGYFCDLIIRAADNIAKGRDVTEELCFICSETKRCGILDEIYKNQGELTPLAECVECPRDNLVIEVSD
jgi:predicted transcriptional regulator